MLEIGGRSGIEVIKEMLTPFLRREI